MGLEHDLGHRRQQPRCGMPLPENDEMRIAAAAAAASNVQHLPQSITRSLRLCMPRFWPLSEILLHRTGYTNMETKLLLTLNIAMENYFLEEFKVLEVSLHMTCTLP